MTGTLQNNFETAANTQPKPRRKRLPPLSIRVTEDEKKRLEKLAGDQSINAYVRSKILGDKSKRNAPYRETLARLLARMGETEIGPSLRTLARSAEIGALIVDAETKAQLNTALVALITMRQELIKALSR
ncbi:hypothetical protein [Ponticaulis koreensis]|uniref:hypothetical protein n=1 Tax=Ponticaulis koreensis TaxID=1123045 RepID=UPI0003B53211|nr:hypothetical protein [Ponticaulis koreensis]